MAHQLEDNKPFGGLNFDDSDLQINHAPNGQPVAWQDYRYAKNIRNAINKSARGKALTNVSSPVEVTKYLLPYSGGQAPLGKNKVIGQVEDTKYNTVVYAVWNSNGNHQILRYYRNNTDPNNPYGEVQQVMVYNFGWTKNQRITDMNIVYGTPPTGVPLDESMTAGDLLYWSDTKPRKINLTKANICRESKSWAVYVPATFNVFAVPGTFTFDLQDYSGSYIAAISFATPVFDNNHDGIKYIADYLNANYGGVLTAEACDCHLEITEIGQNGFYATTSGIPTKIYASGWYGALLDDRFFDRCKWQPLNAPQGTYAQDANYEPNYVQKKVFQFRLGYYYDDFEESALGVYSQIPINNLSCDGTNNTKYNYIDVNFEDSLLTNYTTLVLMKNIQFIARELNTGSDKLVVKELKPCEFLDYDGTDWYCHFKFYNNIISTPIDANRAAQLYDDVPLESIAELFVKNRMTEAAVKTGYDAPECVVAKTQMEFVETPNAELFDVTFFVRVVTYGLSDGEHSGTARNFVSMFPQFHKYPFYSPSFNIARGGIFHDITRTENDFAFFGGGGFGTGGGGDFGIRAGMEDVFDQRIPEGGWPIYAAGTPYFGVTKQINIGLPSDGNGALDSSTTQRRIAIGQYLYQSPNKDLFSSVTIKVPKGEYIFRVASHWCSFAGNDGQDKLGKGFMYNLSSGTNYQKTSTNVLGIIPPGNFPMNTFSPTKEIKINVTSDISDAGSFIVLDLAPPWDANIFGAAPNDLWSPFNCYLYDDSNGASVNTDPNSPVFRGVPVEKALVLYNYDPTYYTQTYSSNFYDDACCTDHNGYFYGIGEFNFYYFTFRAYQVNQQISNTQIFWVGDLTKLANKELSAITPAGGDRKLLEAIITTTVATARTGSSTDIIGTVIDGITSSPINGVSVIYENGRTTTTGDNGQYSLLVWGDEVSPNIPNFPIGNNSGNNGQPMVIGTSRVNDSLIFNLSISCSPSYPNGQELSPILITPFGINGTDTPPPYSPTAKYDAGTFQVNEGNNPNQKSHKRGGNYTYVGRLYDDSGRLCTCFRLFDMYVPFITEDLGKYGIEDFTGTVYPSGTYRYGKPSIKWILDSNTTFPTWAKYFQWMRVKNSIYGRYLQWVTNQVTYISALATSTTPEIDTSFQNSDATAIKISLSNIVDYAASNNDSTIGYQYEAGDRMRLIANRNIENYQGINDFEVTSYDAASQSIYIKPEGFPTEIQSGSLIEIFNPKSIATEDEQIYWEVGEVVKIDNGIPEKFNGIFTNGDTYWRGRLIIVNDDATKYASAYPVVIEDAAVSDFYSSTAQDIGRPGTIDPSFKQIWLPTGGRASGQYNPGTASNGLSTFDPNLMPTFEIDRRYGQVMRLFYEQNNLMAICSNKEVSNYINRQTLYQAEANTGVVGLTGEFFGTQYIHAQNLGTDLPASVVTNTGYIWGWNNSLANVWKYQGDGEQVISDVKAVTHFKRLQDEGILDAVAIYDRFYEEYIVTYSRKKQTITTTVGGTRPEVIVLFETAPEFSVDADITLQLSSNPDWISYPGTVTKIELIDSKWYVTVYLDGGFGIKPFSTVNVIYGVKETISWCEGSAIEPVKRWRTFYDFTPECYASLGPEILSFVDGKLYIHDKNNALRNNFYGTQYNSSITPVFNSERDLMKVWNALWMKMTQSDKNCNWYAPVITNMYEQQSRLKSVNWVKQENNWYIPFLRDLTDTVPANPILNGRELRSEALEVNLVNDFTGEITLYGWRCNFTLSERTSK